MLDFILVNTTKNIIWMYFLSVVVHILEKLTIVNTGSDMTRRKF